MSILQSYPQGTPKKGDYIIGTSIPAANSDDKPTTKNFTVQSIASFANAPVAYESYVFSFVAGPTAPLDPVVTVMKNTTGLTFTFLRSAAGVYTLTPSSSFVINKTWIQCTGNGNGFNGILNVSAMATGDIALSMTNVSSLSTQDGVEYGFVELRIYS